MDRFDFQLVLIGVVLGLGIAELLTCVSHMLLARHRTRVYWVHLVWLVTLFLVAVQYWHSLFSWKSLGSLGDSFFHYLLTLMLPVTLFVAAAMVGPNVPPNAEVFDFREYYYQNHRGIFTACAVTLATMIVGNNVHLDAPWFGGINLYRYLALALVISLAVSSDRRLHSVAAIVLLAMLLGFVVLLAGG